MNRDMMGLIALAVTLAAFAALAYLAQAVRKPDAPARAGRWGDYPFWLRCLVLATIINFASFLLISLWLGGDALGGYAGDGHYYLGYKGHYKEVSRAVYNYSRIHGISAFGLILVTIFVAGFPTFGENK